MERFSEAAKRLKGQEMFQILAKTQELEREGRQILHFELGDPDFNTPENIVNVAINSLKNGETHYTNSYGLLELRATAARAMETGIRGFKPDLDQILVTPGANIEIYYAAVCTTNPGEEIIVPDPGFVSYFAVLDFLGIKSVRVPLHEKNEFRLNPADVEKAITDKTRMIILNSPSNPTGSVMTEEEIRNVYNIAKVKDIYILTDEVYRRLFYGDEKNRFFSPSMIDQCKERTIVANGFSKSYAMTGWRLGVMIGPSDIITKMNLLLETTSSCVSPFIQRGGIEALCGSQEIVNNMVNEYRRRRDIIVDGLNSLPGVKCIKPKGAFYAFPNITKTGMNSKEFADFMLNEAGVAVAPGNIFGDYGEGYIRMAYANSVENIKVGISRMNYALKK
ncbi:MAG: pyridoxal phosphate-dependent aminotransferase [Pseudomonadota bacterium]